MAMRDHKDFESVPEALAYADAGMADRPRIDVEVLEEVPLIAAQQSATELDDPDDEDEDDDEPVVAEPTEGETLQV